MADVRVNILGDEKDLLRALRRSSRATNEFGARVDSDFARAGQKGAKSFATAFTGTGRRAFLAGFGGIGAGLAVSEVTQQLRQVIGVAAEAQQVIGQTRVALETTGKSWDQYGDQIEKAVAAQSKLGFDDEALLQSFSLFIRGTDSVTEALRRNRLAMDVARARFIDLSAAANIVNKAALGQSGALRRLGIQVDKNATSTELLAALQAKFGGAAQAASEDASTAMDRFAVASENAQEAVGTLLLPAVVALSEVLTDVAEFTTKATEELKKLGKVKIPAIELPFDITIGGKSIGEFAGEAGGLFSDALKNAIIPGAGPILTVLQLIRDSGEKTSREVNADLQSIFAATQKAFTSSLRPADLGGRAGAGGPAAFGEPGFKPLKPPPILTEIPKRLQEALIDAQIRAPDNIQAQIEILRRQADSLRRILEDPRLKQAQRIDIKKDLGGVLGAINTLSDQIADGIKRAGDARQAKIKAAAEAAKEAAEKAAADAKDAHDTMVKLGQEMRERFERAVQAQQFRVIGLGAEGGALVPGVENLRKQLAQLTDRLGDSGKELGTKLSQQLKGARRLLRGDFGALTEDSRSAINDLFRTIRGEFDQETRKGPLTPTSKLNPEDLLDGLGLGRDLQNELRSRLLRFNTAGVALAGTAPARLGGVSQAPVSVSTQVDVILDGERVGRSVTKTQQKQKRRNPPQKRGPNTRGI